MFRNLRVLGLALISVSVIAAGEPLQASASPQFTCAQNGVHVSCNIKGTTSPGAVEQLVLGGATIDCHNSYQGSDADGTTVGLTAKLTGQKTPNTFGEACIATTAGVEFKADINYNSCDYEFFLESKIAGGEYTGTTEILCNTVGDAIDIKVTSSTGATKCTIKVPGQWFRHHLIFRNQQFFPTEDISVEGTVSGITYSTEGGLLNCGISNGEHLGGEYKGQVTLEAFNTSGTAIDLTAAGE